MMLHLTAPPANPLTDFYIIRTLLLDGFEYSLPLYIKYRISARRPRPSSFPHSFFFDVNYFIIIIIIIIIIFISSWYIQQ